MALCDRLEAGLDSAAATRRRLLDALLAEALAPPTITNGGGGMTGPDERERPAARQASCFRMCSALERSALPGCGSTLSSLTTPSTTSIE